MRVSLTASETKHSAASSSSCPGAPPAPAPTPTPPGDSPSCSNDAGALSPMPCAPQPASAPARRFRGVQLMGLLAGILLVESASDISAHTPTTAGLVAPTSAVGSVLQPIPVPPTNSRGTGTKSSSSPPSAASTAPSSPLSISSEGRSRLRPLASPAASRKPSSAASRSATNVAVKTESSTGSGSFVMASATPLGTCGAAEGSEEHACQMCGQTYSTAGNLRSHMDTHGPGFPCKFCPKVFTRRHGLRAHVRSQHQGIRPAKDSGRWPCSSCGRVFNRKSNRERHYKTSNHGAVSEVRKPHQCPSCDGRFASLAALHRHVRCCASSSSNTPEMAALLDSPNTMLSPLSLESVSRPRSSLGAKASQASSSSQTAFELKPRTAALTLVPLEPIDALPVVSAEPLLALPVVAAEPVDADGAASDDDLSVADTISVASCKSAPSSPSVAAPMPLGLTPILPLAPLGVKTAPTTCGPPVCPFGLGSMPVCVDEEESFSPLASRAGDFDAMDVDMDLCAFHAGEEDDFFAADGNHSRHAPKSPGILPPFDPHFPPSFHETVLDDLPEPQFDAVLF